MPVCASGPIHRHYSGRRQHSAHRPCDTATPVGFRLSPSDRQRLCIGRRHYSARYHANRFRPRQAISTDVYRAPTPFSRQYCGGTPTLRPIAARLEGKKTKKKNIKRSSFLSFCYTLRPLNIKTGFSQNLKLQKFPIFRDRAIRIALGWIINRSIFHTNQSVLW